MGVINTGSFAKALWPGINAWFGQSYKEWPEEYKMLLKIQRFVLRKKLRGRCPSRKIANLMPVRYGYNLHRI